MERREFLKISSMALAGGALYQLGCQRFFTRENSMERFRRYYGFNLTEKTGGGGPRRKFNEHDFEFMAEWGFNFARIPLSYWNWASPQDWYTIREEVFDDIDEVIEFGRQYGVHINLNFHRIPGYCINGRDREPMDLFEDTPERMAKALDAAVYHWKYFARRYKGISSTLLSFDLINEPPKNTNEQRYEVIVRTLVQAIREVDPERLIVVDGKDIGRNPMTSIVDLNVVQSTRGYDPMAVSHYTATWVPDDEKETFNPPTWPLVADNGKVWDKEALREKLIGRWKPITSKGAIVHVGEWGCFNKTPHDVCLAWMRDILSLWKEAQWGWAMWNLRGSFGILDSERNDVSYEQYKGHQLDRKMLELLLEYKA